ncbi:unnamed protein product [Adineta ricciae]|uniref:RRM domain-containing protein n=1 Tax=Adineta ricciae TaxID=249248 RepID=A0A814L2A1_ADIRI|nr:unnamed protein product [Adineta ricciae]CAF1537776.1 unnamed protein product [Adineta ricciae]
MYSLATAGSAAAAPTISTRSFLSPGWYSYNPMSTESLTSKLLLNANTSNSPSTTPTSSSPVTVNGTDHHHHQQQQMNGNGNGILNDGKLSINSYQNGVLPDIQATFQGSSWSNGIDPLSGASGDHPFDVHNSGRMFSPQTTTPPPLMAMQQQQQQQQQLSYQQAIQRRPITASHNFSNQTLRNGISAPPSQAAPSLNGRGAIPSPLWNSQYPQTNLSMPPSHMQQQQPPSPSWNNTSIPHGFPATSSRRPVPSLTNPIGNGSATANNLSQTLMLGNGNHPMSQTKKTSSLNAQNNFFPFLPTSSTSITNQNKYNNIQSLSTQLQRAPAMTNFIPTQNGQSPPPPPPPHMNGNDVDQNFPAMNSADAYDMSSFQQIMDMMRNVSSDGVKRVYSDDSGMGSILDTESLISVGGGCGGPSSSSAGLFGSPRAMSMDMNKEERFSRKVFVGGLPPDIDEEEIIAHFQRFGPLIVDWPHKQESKSYFPPKGYAFLIFTYERSVQELIDECVIDDSKLYMCVSSPSMKDKAVQIRPWLLADSDFVMDGSQPLDPRKTIFVGGVPRPLRAVELAMIMDRLYGGVCYAGIDTDPELKYPKGAGRVAFSNQQSYIAAISARFVQLQHGEIDKRVEVKPYVLDDQLCDECAGARCGGKFAPFFCANVTCLQYYCETCWASIHARAGREYHKPLVKEGADRPRTLPFRW